MSNRTFDIIDKWAIRNILRYLDINSILLIKKCSTRIYKICIGYLKEVYYKTAYLNDQHKILNQQLKELELKKKQISKVIEDIRSYGRHSNTKPYCYMFAIQVTDINSVYQRLKWKLESPKSANANNYQYSYDRILLVKSQQSTEVYNKTDAEMDMYGFRRVFLLPIFRNNKTIHSMYVKILGNGKVSKKYSVFYKCKICKGDHSLLRCPNVRCNICKIKGHLTQRCPNTKCKICKAVGKHLTSRCPLIRCKQCKQKGHIAKRCNKSRKY